MAAEVRWITGVGAAHVDVQTGCFLDVNDTLCEMVGFSREELLRKDVVSLTHPDDLHAARQRLEVAKANGIAPGAHDAYEKRYRRRDGGWVWVRVRAFHIVDGDGQMQGVAIIEDLTQERHAAEELRQSRERFEAAMHAASEGLWDWDILTGADYFSDRWCELLGYPKQELSPTYDTWLERLHPDDKPWVLDTLKRHLDRVGPYDVEYRLRTKSGEYRWFRARGQAVWSEEGLPVRMAGSIADVTDKRKFEEAFFQATIKVQRRNADLEEIEAARRAMGDRLAATTHEIRTPLNGLTTLAALLQESPLTDSQSQLVAKMRSSCQHLMQVLNDVLDQAKLEAHQLEVERVPFPIRAVLERSTNMLTEWASSKGVRVRWEVERGTPASAMGDPLRVQQVLVNLLNNGVKFSERGEVVMRANSTGSSIRFEVRDRGIGMKPEVRERIFERFQQADRSTAKRYGGTGLGLSLARDFVELMGGQIGVESEWGVGSTFWFSLPAAEGAEAPDAVLPLGLRVLVVEDNAINQILARRQLEGLGAEVAMAGSGEEAISQLESRPFDAVLMDLQLPGADGTETTRQIRLSGLSTLPIFGVSASDLADDRRRCLAAGMTACIAKPLDLDQLRRALAEHCRRAPANAC